MSNSAFSSLNEYIEGKQQQGPLIDARSDASEYSLPTPSVAVGELLGTLAATAGSAGAPGSAAAASASGAGASGAATAGPATGAVAITPAAGVVGLHILAGLPAKASLTCIDPEADHQARAKAAFRDAGFGASRARFLPSRPLDVLGRLATGAYHLVYADVDPVDLPAVIKAAWPLLSPGGTLVLSGSLLDATITDPTRKDRGTLAAREADELVEKLAAGEAEGFEGESAVVTRLPLDSGITLVTRRA